MSRSNWAGARLLGGSRVPLNPDGGLRQTAPPRGDSPGHGRRIVDWGVGLRPDVGTAWPRELHAAVDSHLEACSVRWVASAVLRRRRGGLLVEVPEGIGHGHHDAPGLASWVEVVRSRL